MTSSREVKGQEVAERLREIARCEQGRALPHSDRAFLRHIADSTEQVEGLLTEVGRWLAGYADGSIPGAEAAIVAQRIEDGLPPEPKDTAPEGDWDLNDQKDYAAFQHDKAAHPIWGDPAVSDTIKDEFRRVEEEKRRWQDWHSRADSEAERLMVRADEAEQRVERADQEIGKLEDALDRQEARAASAERQAAILRTWLKQASELAERAEQRVDSLERELLREAGHRAAAARCEAAELAGKVEAAEKGAEKIDERYVNCRAEWLEQVQRAEQAEQRADSLQKRLGGVREKVEAWATEAEQLASSITGHDDPQSRNDEECRRAAFAEVLDLLSEDSPSVGTPPCVTYPHDLPAGGRLEASGKPDSPSCENAHRPKDGSPTLAQQLRAKAEQAGEVHTTARQGWLDAADFVEGRPPETVHAEDYPDPPSEKLQAELAEAVSIAFRRLVERGEIQRGDRDLVRCGKRQPPETEEKPLTYECPVCHHPLRNPNEVCHGAFYERDHPFGVRAVPAEQPSETEDQGEK